jgi:hypothetical protein
MNHAPSLTGSTSARARADGKKGPPGFMRQWAEAVSTPLPPPLRVPPELSISTSDGPCPRYDPFPAAHAFKSWRSTSRTASVERREAFGAVPLEGFLDLVEVAPGNPRSLAGLAHAGKLLGQGEHSHPRLDKLFLGCSSSSPFGKSEFANPNLPPENPGAPNPTFPQLPQPSAGCNNCLEISRQVHVNLRPPFRRRRARGHGARRLPK